uniref:Peptidase C31 domain-containing protein n=1 Tax=Glossina pallidipes TaxID=7398 RepID=A0A1B0GGN7_GLOPL
MKTKSNQGIYPVATCCNTTGKSPQMNSPYKYEIYPNKTGDERNKAILYNMYGDKWNSLNSLLTDDEPFFIKGFDVFQVVLPHQTANKGFLTKVRSRAYRPGRPSYGGNEKWSGICYKTYRDDTCKPSGYKKLCGYYKVKRMNA